MRIPQIDTERRRGMCYMLQAEKLFNPVLHASESDARETFDNECRCGSKDPDDYYPNNKKRCKACVKRRVLQLRRGEAMRTKPRKRSYARCDCGATGEESFYFSHGKILYPCKQCRKKLYYDTTNIIRPDARCGDSRQRE